MTPRNAVELPLHLESVLCFGPAIGRCVASGARTRCEQTCARIVRGRGRLPQPCLTLSDAADYDVRLFAAVNPFPPHSSVKIHEYQAKSVLARFGVPVPRGEVAFVGRRSRRHRPPPRRRHRRRQGADSRRRPRQGRRRQARQVRRGGRADRQADARHDARHAPDRARRPKVGRVLIEEGLQIDRELYVSIVIDRAAACPVIIASAAGGMDIEEVAATQPEKILREVHRPRHRHHSVPGAQAGLRHGAAGRAGRTSWSRCSTRSTRRSSRPTPR